MSITDEQRAIGESISAWAAGAGVLPTVRGADGAKHWREHWADLAHFGLFEMVDGPVADVAMALEHVAKALVPGPVLPTVLTGVLLGRAKDSQVSREFLPGLTEGGVPVALGLRPGAPVIGYAPYLLTRSAGVWTLAEAELTQRDALDFSRPLSQVERLRDGHVLDVEGVEDLAVTLAAAEAVGVAGWCLATAVEYAKVRQQFGKPIGSFQAVKHLCAGMVSRVEEARAAAWDAARAADEAPGEHPLAAAVAGAVALEAAVETAKDCVQVLGGIGFTWEHDAHLYLRRALALRALFGGTSYWRRKVAELALGGARRQVRPVSEADSRTSALVGEIAELPADRQRARLAETGLLVPEWPKPYGMDAAPQQQLMIADELRRKGVTRPDLVIGAWAAPTILRHGTAEQRDRFVWPTLRGEITWCQLFSEPEAGSDLASLRTRAVKADGGYRLRGQKVWTSRAAEADWAICLARTDSEVPKHEGITYFLVDMRSAGLSIRPLREITGDAMFNEVFLDDVFVPDDCVVGQPGDGWKLARTTLANERVAMGGASSFGAEVETLLSTARTRGAEPEKLGELVAGGLVVSLMDQFGTDPSIRKLVGVRHRQAVAEATLDLYGTDAALADVAADAIHAFLMTRCLSIAGGTTQILSTLAAERVLGLPRT
ncbi:acyl-CoA dehydrogenase family protein [Kibdelosporangium phytohabitans]|uniref:Acyl-CoA dehydrogenase n=1 Tax=Kibdelosporangium phytohabitans TaxID=860235 RepID=A0A0N7F4Y3_9PSEU|nr:acyl-CoA dehydrogenase family protein [Kibdelosporangium phytohabitans]ALG12711.1 acyl-CoA dehydrogenase [Kibdelosporangium phytohabitans]MBE1464378.1 alkylation response protein AidB-like acyl-CoA dehydrogenase [Kibdelosporangium phytohabitans]